MLDGTRISYGDLIARAGQMANVLVARGVKPGDRVAAQTEKSVPALVLYLATVRAGAVYLPLNTAYTLNELDYFISDAEPSLVVCDPSKAEGIGAIAAKVKAKVETLGPDGKGSLTDAAAKAEAAFTTVARSIPVQPPRLLIRAERRAREHAGLAVELVLVKPEPGEAALHLLDVFALEL